MSIHSGHMGRADAPDFDAMSWDAMTPEQRAIETARFEAQQQAAMTEYRTAETARTESRVAAWALIEPVVVGLIEAGVAVDEAALLESATMGGKVLESQQHQINGKWDWGIPCIATATQENRRTREVLEIGITDGEIIAVLNARSKRRRIMRVPR